MAGKKSTPSLMGQRFTRLVVLDRAGSNARGTSRWLVQCDCGTRKIVRGDVLTRKAEPTKSCGCLHLEILRRSHRLVHGDSRSAEWWTWIGMIQRCEDANHHNWERYGGRGITVCERWRSSYAVFLADMGRKPSPKHSIDRYPNNSGNYEPGNCRWATASEQRQNQRN